MNSQSDLCEVGHVTDYCWNCIHLHEDIDGLAFCSNNPDHPRTMRYLPSTLKAIEE